MASNVTPDVKFVLNNYTITKMHRKFVKPKLGHRNYKLECRLHPGAVVYCKRSGAQYCPKCRSCCFSCTGGADPQKPINPPKRPVLMNRTRAARVQPVPEIDNG